MNRIKLNLIFSILFVCVFFVSCLKNKKEYFDNGNLKAEYQKTKNGILEGKYIKYYENGNIKSIQLFRNNVEIDSTIVYDSLKSNTIKTAIYRNKNSIDSIYVKNYDNSYITSEGHMFKTQKTGKWKLYKNQKIDKIMQYKNIDGKQYLNQGWFFDKSGDTIHEYGSNYKFKYSVKLKEKTIDISIKYKPLIAENANVILLHNEKLNKEFSNIDEVVLDTIFFTNNKVDIEYKVKHKREKLNFNLRGIIKEYADLLKNDSIYYRERLIYLDEKIVK
ncbi:toxin-antitoxin system YwqK family antitoxin [Psychroserpens ponticola]|uniref:Toxin-antitoxin system YwqK family antitoxin n=1 Tax=Psychroserpens ponticola TaxID=2932268 RepID=A0ABY7S267_9FLAO|nr:hypothetical protein [Psychroserpens ponticola]WCO03489.1 hypothetical protein MUN68_008265 [Psychroserpens ponticola]